MKTYHIRLPKKIAGQGTVGHIAAKKAAVIGGEQWAISGTLLSSTNRGLGDQGRNMGHRRQKISKKRRLLLFVLPVVIVAVGGGAYAIRQSTATTKQAAQTTGNSEIGAPAQATKTTPLTGRTFYRDDSREVTKQTAKFKQQGDADKAKLLEKISSQPSTLWLTGPSAGDPRGNRDITNVVRTSQEAAAQNTVPVYMLYAIPQRDACAGFSSGGFQTTDEYLKWVDRIATSLKSDAVIALEPDAVPHTVQTNCLDGQEINERYKTLATAIARLRESPKVLGVYLDAGHSEWFNDPTKLVEPLKRAGIDQATGVTVNVSNFIATPDITKWSQELIRQLGGNKGVLIDTSRNGRGPAPGNITGDARWCNPAGRGLGKVPTTNVADEYIHAYVWLKIPGESDGACDGNPPAGTFNLPKALELATNAEQ